jgi:PIN domain nuclease of toxin-antitoxin system
VRRLLLDSHVVLWWLNDDARLGATARSLITEADEVFVSVVTPWELGIKRALGKLSYPDLVEIAIEQGFVMLPINAFHSQAAPELPRHHNDPFDRMLVAQSQLEGLDLVSADDQLIAYRPDLIDATK